MSFLRGNMTLYDLIFKAGGYKDSEFKKKTYLDRAELVRVNIDSDEKELIPFNLGLVLKKKELPTKFFFLKIMLQFIQTLKLKETLDTFQFQGM